MKNTQTKLNIIYGRSGTGKSQYIYKDIDKKINKFKNIYIIVPEQSNLSSERKFFEITKRDSLFNCEVLTLSRMAYRIANEVGREGKTLSKTSKAMIIYDLLSKNKKNLNFLGKSEKNIDIVEKMFTELKKHNISVEDLKKIELESQYTNLKLNDIKILYEEYEKRISEKFIDENDELTILSGQIKDSNMFENASIYIDDFYGFTPQEYCILEELIVKCDEVSIAICLDEIESTKNKENDIFYFNRKYAKKILEIAERQNCDIHLVNMDKFYRFKNQELLQLEKNLCYNNEIYTKKTENIELFLASNPYSEVENVAKTIYDLVKNQGFKYREIGIVTTDIENYGIDSKAIFQKYNIPIFIDEKKDLNQNILIKYIMALLDVFKNNWSYEAFFQYLKIGLLNIDDYDIYLLENYCKKWGIKGSKWYKRPFDYEPLNETQEKLENLRLKIVEPLLNFKNNFYEKKTVFELTCNLYEFLLQNKIVENLDEKIKKYDNLEISNEYNTSYQILIHVLEEIVELFGEEKITFERYRDLLTVGIKASELGKIPVSQDQVILGDIDRTRSNNIKILFVIRNE